MLVLAGLHHVSEDLLRTLDTEVALIIVIFFASVNPESLLDSQGDRLCSPLYTSRLQARDVPTPPRAVADLVGVELSIVTHIPPGNVVRQLSLMWFRSWLTELSLHSYRFT